MHYQPFVIIKHKNYYENVIKIKAIMENIFTKVENKVEDIIFLYVTYYLLKRLRQDLFFCTHV